MSTPRRRRLLIMAVSGMLGLWVGSVAGGIPLLMDAMRRKDAVSTETPAQADPGPASRPATVPHPLDSGLKVGR